MKALLSLLVGVDRPIAGCQLATATIAPRPLPPPSLAKSPWLSRAEAGPGWPLRIVADPGTHNGVQSGCFSGQERFFPRRTPPGYCPSDIEKSREPDSLGGPEGSSSPVCRLGPLEELLRQLEPFRYALTVLGPSWSLVEPLKFRNSWAGLFATRGNPTVLSRKDDRGEP